MLREELKFIARPTSLPGSKFRPIRKRAQPNISLRIHASIRRQLKDGAADPSGIASAALKDALANQ